MAREITDPELKDDAALLVSQAERCRDILKRLSQTQEASDRMHDRLALGDALEEAAAPLQGLGPPIRIRLDPPADDPEPPRIKRRAEVLYALGNFIENAVDFARSEVIVTGAWTADQIIVTIADDGPGFPSDILAKLGEPYITTRRAEPGAGGLGLGVFIAITLAERVGGRAGFSNAPSGGAVVTLTLSRQRLRADPLIPLRPDAADRSG
jgi:two-component system sensor histidine kinase RegB